MREVETPEGVEPTETAADVELGEASTDAPDPVDPKRPVSDLGGDQANEPTNAVNDNTAEKTGLGE